MNTTIERFARYIALPAVSAGIIGGAALGLAGAANAATYSAPSAAARRGKPGRPVPTRPPMRFRRHNWHHGIHGQPSTLTGTATNIPLNNRDRGPPRIDPGEGFFVALHPVAAPLPPIGGHAIPPVQRPITRQTSPRNARQLSQRRRDRQDNRKPNNSTGEFK